MQVIYDLGVIIPLLYVGVILPLTILGIAVYICQRIIRRPKTETIVTVPPAELVGRLACKGVNANVCVAEGCFNGECIK